MKALVTGSSGFIGGHLAETLAGRGDDACCLVRKTSNIQWLEKINVRLVCGECRDQESLHSTVRGVDYVFHLAAAIYAPNWETYYQVNTLGTQNLIEACLAANPTLKKFVFVSSISAAGPSPKGKSLREDDECRPISDYGRSKWLAEQIVLKYGTRIPVTILRPPNVIGPRQKELFESIKLIQKRILPLMGRFEPRTSLCSVADVVQAAILLAEHKEADGKIYYVAESRPYSWAEVTDAIAEALGVDRFILKVPYGIQYLAAGFAEVLSRLTGKTPLVNRGSVVAARKYDWVYDSSRIEKELGFQARDTMPETIRRTVDWYREQGLL
ncbi:MAG: NAD-dependent epimerase/dehydratase family protein [Candidatus Aminicenantales bacterium]